MPFCLLMSTPTMFTNLFTVDIPNVQAGHIAQVHGLHLSFGKSLVTPQVGLRHQFLPGAPQYDDISIQISVTSTGTTASDFDAWAQNVSNGQIDNRTAVIHALDATFQLVEDITLFNLSPVAFPAFTTSTFGRTIILSLGRFEFQ